MLKTGLIVSCQAPKNSPLHDADIISAMAETAYHHGAIAVRIDSPAHVLATRKKVPIPIIGLWKQQLPNYDVYITPRFSDVEAIAQAGADIIAIDATLRNRPEDLTDLIAKIHGLGKLVMADIDTISAAIAAEIAGADFIGTTLYGYTEETANLKPPGFDLLTEMVAKIQVPCICEGGISSPEMAKKALELGAIAVVVGTAITGIDLLTQSYIQALVSEGEAG
jgi:N-acylglucosamine-6-phosphate 2-epimerase